MASSQTGGRFCLEKYASSLLQREPFYQLQRGTLMVTIHGILWCEGQRGDGGEKSHQYSALSGRPFWAHQFPDTVPRGDLVLQACVTSKRLYSAGIKICCLSSAPSLLSLIPSIKLETGTTRHPQCACTPLWWDLETGSFEFHRFPKRWPMQMVSGEMNGVGVEHSGKEHKVRVWPL